MRWLLIAGTFVVAALGAHAVSGGEAPTRVVEVSGTETPEPVETPDATPEPTETPDATPRPTETPDVTAGATETPDAPDDSDGRDDDRGRDRDDEDRSGSNSGPG